MPVVWVPPLMQKLSGGQTQVTVEGETVRQVIDNLDAVFPGFKDRLCEDGSIRHDIAIAVDGEISSQGLRKKVLATSEVHFLPALAGG
jgi:sulfur-carrier protein